MLRFYVKTIKIKHDIGENKITMFSINIFG